MKIRSIRPIHGPNVFHHRPVLIMLIDLEDLAEVASNEREGFNERLLKILPSLQNHHCSPGHPGGFVERLKRGTYPAHIIEHIALELSELAGIGQKYGKTIYGGEPGVYQVAVRFDSEEGMIEALHSAVELATAVYDCEAFNLDKVIDKIKRAVRRDELGPSTSSILEAAERRNIPWMKLDGLGLIQLGWGKYRKFFQATTTSNTTDIGVQIARDKEFTKKLLSAASIPVPSGELVYSEEEAISAMNDIGGGVVVKPFDGNHGRGVTLDVSTPIEMKEAFRIARGESTGGVLVEECFKGRDYRVVMVEGKMIAASERIAAHVIGDGTSTIKMLVDCENENPIRGEGHERPLTKISFDESALHFLSRKNITLDTIPLKGQKVCLRDTANLSTGGLAEDVTDDVHPEVKRMCERVARVVGLDVCGLDLILADISKPLIEQKGGVIEVNAGPGIRMHHYPSKGTPRDVGGAIVDSMFHDSQSGRIPLISITGTNGKTTVTRVLDHVFLSLGMCPGTTTTNGIFVNGEMISDGDTTGPISARTVLSDPSVDIAVLETARGGIIRRGLGFDWSDVGIITNIHADHIGQDGIETIDDILRIKSLVVERVREGGTIILNADSPELVQLAREKLDTTKRKLVYFSLNEYSPVVQKHVSQGGVAYCVRGESLVCISPYGEEKIVSAALIPLTLGGTASFHIANVLTVIAACEALDVPRSDVIRALKTFVGHDKNKGRTNLYKVGKGHVLLDYGHNPDALIAIGSMTRKWNATKRTGVITTPGDRSDDMIRMSGIAAALVFDKVIVREDNDTRNRAPGEIAQILCQAVNQEKQNAECEIARDPIEALNMAIEQMEQGELVIYFYEDFDSVVENLQSRGGYQTDISTILHEHSIEEVDDDVIAYSAEW
jgi:cyanophycin synthetase